VSSSQETTRPTEPKRADATLGELFKEMTTELSGIFRQEVELAKVETREEVQRGSKAAAAMAVAGVGALLAVLFLSLALAWLLDQGLNTALSFLIVGLLWAIVAAVLISVGRKKLRQVRPLPETTASIKEDMQWAKDLRS
jgi:F0F1-type ATP synthase assembly protein I